MVGPFYTIFYAWTIACTEFYSNNNVREYNKVPTGTLNTVQGLVQGVNEDLGMIPYSTYIQVLFFCKKLNNLSK